MSTAACFDLRAREWSQLPCMRAERGLHVASTMPCSRVSSVGSSFGSVQWTQPINGEPPELGTDDEVYDTTGEEVLTGGDFSTGLGEEGGESEIGEEDALVG